ncbi:MAG: DNA primase [Nitrospirota bacterium]|nr:DNA primase [Nitrospirota bacterium]
MRSDRVLEEIKERIDIVDFIEGYVQLRKSGQNWKGLCPFHTEKTPSFTVSQAKQIYHCFGCGAGGDVIGFLVNYERMSFPEALQVLAEKAGVKLPVFGQDKKAAEKGQQIRNALASATEFYCRKLNESKSASAYIKKRGITDEAMSLFRLGYAPAGWSNLLKHLKQAGYSDAVIREAGLAVAGDKGLYDMFRERVIFPIMGTNGNVIAFGGRAMDDSLPKYINSPETPVFKKSETLYGLYTAKEAIRQKEYALIVEGYMDVIICHQYGFKNGVAPLGTSLTSGHLLKLRKLTKEVVVIFDGDAAGIAAAKRALPLLAQNDFHAKILILPDNEDPDSYLGKHGSESLSILIEKAESVTDFILSASKVQRSQAVREALTVIAERPDAIEAEQMLIELAAKTRISEATLREEYRKLRAKKTGALIKPVRAKAAPRNRAEEELLLSAVIAFPDKADAVLLRIDLDEMKDAAVSSLFRRIAALQDRTNIAGVLDNASEEDRLLFTRLSVAPGFDPEFVDRNIEDCFMNIEKRKFEERLLHARASGDIQLINTLLLEKKKLIKEKDHETR